MGSVCVVKELPKCHWCGATARYDFKTAMGPWAMGCKDCWEMYRAYSTLGTGKGQMWVTKEEAAEAVFKQLGDNGHDSC